MNKVAVVLLLILGVSAFVAQAEPVSMTGMAFVNSQNANYWHIGKEGGGKKISTANIPFEPEKMAPFQGKMVKITGELIPDRKTPTFDKGYKVEAIEETP
jgi:hypothetical protein